MIFSLLQIFLTLMMMMMMMMMMINCFCGMAEQRKAFRIISSQGHLSEILTIANLRRAVSRIWTCSEPELRLCWMKFCSSDNHFTADLIMFADDTIFFYSKKDINTNFLKVNEELQNINERFISYKLCLMWKNKYLFYCKHNKKMIFH